MKKKVKHAFVVCAYKESEYLERCIDSLMRQTVQSPIIICTSTPCVHILRVAEKNGLQLFVREGESDIQADWNFAIERIDAEWITVAHQDDVYNKHYVECLLQAIASGEDAILAFTDYRPILHGKIGMDRNCRIRRLLRMPLKSRKLAGKRWVRKMCLSLGNCICCPSVAYHKTLIDGPVFTSKLKYSLDWDTFLKFASGEHRFLYIDKPLTYYRIHKEATTMEFINNEARKKEDVIMFRKFWPEFVVKWIMKFYVYAYRTYTD
ncbi:MAG: glycosyltransferase family 2 protein [Lachnospiraceae bacterium]